MNWADLRILLAISRDGTFTAAGHRLGLDQTTVRRRLDQLEEALGTRVVVRERHGLRLTPAGERLLRAAEQVEAVVHDAERELLGRDAELHGELRVTTADMVAQHDAALLSGFAERYPGISLTLYTGYAQRSLHRREADVALRFTPKPDAQLFGRKLVRFAYAPYASEALVARVGKVSDLQRLPWLGWDASVGAKATERWMRRRVGQAEVVCRFDGWAALQAAAVAGLGAAIMPCAYADAAGLFRLRPPVPELGYDLWVLTHPDLRHTARVRAFMEYAASYVDARRAAFEGRRRPTRAGDGRRKKKAPTG